MVQQSGFTDTVPVIREATVRSIDLLSPKVRFKLTIRLLTVSIHFVYVAQ